MMRGLELSPLEIELASKWPRIHFITSAQRSPHKTPKQWSVGSLQAGRQVKVLGGDVPDRAGGLSP